MQRNHFCMLLCLSKHMGLNCHILFKAALTSLSPCLLMYTGRTFTCRFMRNDVILVGTNLLSQCACDLQEGTCKQRRRQWARTGEKWTAKIMRHGSDGEQCAPPITWCAS